MTRPLTTEEKAQRMFDALDQLAAKISGDERYDDATALITCSALDTFNREASPESKARLYDLLKGD